MRPRPRLRRPLRLMRRLPSAFTAAVWSSSRPIPSRWPRSPRPAHCGRLREGVSARAEHRPGRGAVPVVDQRPVHGAGAHRPQLSDGALARDWPQAARGLPQVGGLPLGRVPAGPAAGQQPARRRPQRGGQEGARGLRAEPRHAARPGGRARTGQRWPGSTRGLLHRLVGHHECALRRLRHPLRVRHFPADLRRRRTGRAA